MKSKRISMILAWVMTASMLLGGCSGAGGAEPSKLPGMDNVSEKVEETKDDEDKVIAKNEDKEEEKTEEVSGSGSADTNAPFIPYVSRRVIHESDDSGSLFTSDYDLISAGNMAEKYPELEKVLQKRNKDLDESLNQEMKENLDYAKEYNKEWDSKEGFWDNSKLYVQRADDDIFSYTVEAGSFQGGAHGYVGTGGYNFDPKTGKEYKLSDIITSEDELRKILKTKLEENYKDIDWFEDLDSALAMYGENKDYNFDWFIEPYGITFVFNPYGLAAYAYGAQEVTIGFDEEPGLFTGTIGKAEGAYTVRFPIYDYLSVDLDNDGELERIQAYPDYDYDYYDEYTHAYQFKGMSINVGEKSLMDDEGPATYAWDYDLYLVHTEDNRFYIYLNTTSDNDYESMVIYSLSKDGAKKAGVKDGGIYCADTRKMEGEGAWEAALFDPAHFEIGEINSTISTFFATAYYHVGDDGMPVCESDSLTITSDLTLKTAQALEVEYVGETEDISIDAKELRSEGKKEEIPAGTELKLWRTDGTTYTDCLVEDGGKYKVYRLEFETGDDGYRRINGIELEDCFEQVFFAG